LLLLIRLEEIGRLENQVFPRKRIRVGTRRCNKRPIIRDMGGRQSTLINFL
jgi:hypothetical protein